MDILEHIKNNIKYLLFDFETSDLYNKNLPPTHINQAWPVQIGALYLDANLNIIEKFKEFIAPPHPNAIITVGAYDKHKISIDTCRSDGIPHTKMRSILSPILDGNAKPIGHNVWFDLQFVSRYSEKLKELACLEQSKKHSICTMRKTTSFCKLPPTESMKKFKGLNYKAPKLEELYEILFNKKLIEAHDALVDAEATYVCLKELIKRGVIIL